MRLNQQEGAEKLIELVARNAPHSAYMDAVDYAKFWKSIVSGLNQDEIIVSYKPRETPEQKAQRVRLYVSPTKTCSQRASVNMARLRTSDAPQENISYQSETNENDAILATLLVSYSIVFKFVCHFFGNPKKDVNAVIPARAYDRALPGYLALPFLCVHFHQLFFAEYLSFF